VPPERAAVAIDPLSVAPNPERKLLINSSATASRGITTTIASLLPPRDSFDGALIRSSEGCWAGHMRRSESLAETGAPG
jgi:hypothetical protein